ARGVDEAALEILAVREGDGVDEDVQPAPLLAHAGEYLAHLRLVRRIALEDDVGSDALGERTHAALERLVQIGEGELRALLMHRLADAPRDATVVGHAEDERSLPRGEAHICGPFLVPHFGG